MADTTGGAPRGFEVIDGGRSGPMAGPPPENPGLVEALGAHERIDDILEMLQAQEAAGADYRVVSAAAVVSGMDATVAKPLAEMTVSNRNAAPAAEPEATESPESGIVSLRADAIVSRDGSHYVECDARIDGDMLFFGNFPDGSQLVASLDDDGRIRSGTVIGPGRLLRQEWQNSRLVYDRAQATPDGVHRIHAS